MSLSADDESGSEGYSEEEELDELTDTSLDESDDSEEEEEHPKPAEKTTPELTQAQRENRLERIAESLAELSDSSDEEDGPLLRIGNVPLEWYDDEEHIGYDIDGKKVMRRPHGDNIDAFLERTDNREMARRTIYDPYNDRKIVLTDEELAIIRRLRKGMTGKRAYNPYEDYPEHQIERTTESLGPLIEPKRRFVASKWEAKRVVRMINALRNGWIRLDSEEEAQKELQPYMLWGVENEQDEGPNRRKPPPVIPAPKAKLPTHAESYNPPVEYIPTAEEQEKWEDLDDVDRPYNFTPQAYNALRKVPLYSNSLKERFERCLDLYLCPRARKQKINIDPESLIPKLPKPQELKPFPTTLAIVYKGHTDVVYSTSVSPSGEWLASASKDGSVRIWEVDSGRCFRTIRFGGEEVHKVVWNPNPSFPLLLVAVGSKLVILHTFTGSKSENLATKELLTQSPPEASGLSAQTAKTEWVLSDDDSVQDVGNPVESCGHITIELGKAVKHVSWHSKGDYFASSTAQDTSKSVLVHRLSRKHSQAPFSKNKGEIQCVMFHPHKPFFFVVSKRYVRVYNLAKQQLVKKLFSPVQWFSSVDVHASGDHVLLGSYDRRVVWYDLDLSSRPYKTLKFHSKAVRDVTFHPSPGAFPLFASCSDDGSVHVFHARVYNDLMTSPLIVPVKIIRAHDVTSDGIGITSLQWHPSQPWLFSSGGDGTIKLFYG